MSRKSYAPKGPFGLVKPKTPEVPPTPRMPDPESPEIKEAQKKAQDAIYARTGRRSTILH